MLLPPPNEPPEEELLLRVLPPKELPELVERAVDVELELEDDR